VISRKPRFLVKLVSSREQRRQLVDFERWTGRMSDPDLHPPTARGVRLEVSIVDRLLEHRPQQLYQLSD